MTKPIGHNPPLSGTPVQPRTEGESIPREREGASENQSLRLADGWQRRFVDITHSEGWSPRGIIAQGRKPTKPAGAKPTKSSGKKTSRAVKKAPATSAKLEQYRAILAHGIDNVDDLRRAKELVTAVSPMGRAIFEAFDRFLETEKRKDELDDRFEFIFPGVGSYAARRGDQDRITSWGAAVSLEEGAPVFVLIHEIVHAMPLGELPPELIRIPYRSPNREGLSFEDRFVRTLESAYHDEAISGLAEMVLLRDFVRAGAPLPKKGEDGYVDHVRAMRSVYRKRGLDTYLDSELYIGRNHRIEYNKDRMVGLLVSAMLSPEQLRDVTVASVLAEGGVRINAVPGSDAAAVIEQLQAVMKDPTSENIRALMMRVPKLWQYVTLNPEVMFARVREYFEALKSGRNPRRGEGFLGRRDVTVGALRLMGKARAVYNDYIQQRLNRPAPSQDASQKSSDGLTPEERAIYDTFTKTGYHPVDHRHDREMERRLKALEGKISEGDASAQRTMVIYHKVEAAKEKGFEQLLEGTKPKGKTEPQEKETPIAIPSTYEALDALWNMTLDLAREAKGARRATLMKRAGIVRAHLDDPSAMQNFIVPVKSAHALRERYGGYPKNKVSDSSEWYDVFAMLAKAWKDVRDLHASVILHDTDNAAGLLRSIGAHIDAAHKDIVSDDFIDDFNVFISGIGAVGIETPQIMARVAQIMRSASKLGLALDGAYVKELAAAARSLTALLESSWILEDDDNDDDDETSTVSGSRIIVESSFHDGHARGRPAFNAQAQRAYAAFFFELLGNPAMRDLAVDYARLFSGSPLGFLFYRHLYPSIDEMTRQWVGYSSFFSTFDFSDFFLGSPSRRAHDHEPTEGGIDRAPGHGSYLRFKALHAIVGKETVYNVREALNSVLASSSTEAERILALPAHELPMEPSRMEGVLIQRDENGIELRHIVMDGDYVPLFKAWANMIALDHFSEQNQQHMLRTIDELMHDDVPRSGGVRTLSAALQMSHVRMLAARGDVAAADVHLDRHQALLYDASDGAEDRSLASDMASLVRTQVALAVHAKGDRVEAMRRIGDLHDYYESIVRLRRQGVYPDGMARAAHALSRYPAYRAAAHKMLTLAIEHIAAFKNDVRVFPGALEWLVKSIDGSALPYDVREDLMCELVRTVIPEIRMASGFSPQEMQLRAHYVARVNGVMYECGLSSYLARYQSAEALLYNRTADLLDEYGAMATSNAQFREHFLQAAMRINREIALMRPELVDARNIGAFQRMNDSSAFELTLADVFPGELAVFDPHVPVAAWNPVMVRRGLPDPQRSFARIAAAIEHDASDEELAVYGAFVRWEVDRAAAAKPRNNKMLENIIDAHNRRMADGMDEDDTDRDDLTIIPRYAAGIGKKLSRRELMNLSDLLKLSSVAFAFDRLGSVFDEERRIDSTDERIVYAALDAREPHEAQSKRELFLYTLIHPAATLPLKRRAAYNLALSFSHEDAMGRLIDAHEKGGDGVAENLFYARITGFWQLTGQVPSDYYLMLLDGAANGSADPIRRLETIMQTGRIEATVLDIELKYGWTRYYERMIEDFQDCIDNGFRVSTEIVHRDEAAKLIIPLKAQPRRARELVRDLRVRHQEREESARIVRMNLPNIFLKQPPVVRFLLLSYFNMLDGAERARLVQEMNELERAEGRAETFMHFFEMTGLEKLGQTLSTLVGIVPDHDRAIFAKLQDDVPAGSPVEIRQTIERELGAKIEELFDDFSATPVASASIAEVYRARYRETNETVYLKVVPPSKRQKILETARRLTHLADMFEMNRERFPTGIDIAGMLGWFAGELKEQVNLSREINNAASFENAYGANVPYYVNRARNVLMMRPLAGANAAAGSATNDRSWAARDVASIGMGAVLSGYYHADPHPGNIFIDDATQTVSWLDFGTMGRLTAHERARLMEFLFALAFGHPEAQRTALEALGAATPDYDPQALESALTKLADIDAAKRAARMLTAAGEAGLYAERPYSQAVANMLTITGIVRELDPNFDVTGAVADLVRENYAEALTQAQREADTAQHSTDGSADTSLGRGTARKKKGSGSGSGSGPASAPGTPSAPPAPSAPPQHLSFTDANRLDLAGPACMNDTSLSSVARPVPGGMNFMQPQMMMPIQLRPRTRGPVIRL